MTDGQKPVKANWVQNKVLHMTLCALAAFWSLASFTSYAWGLAFRASGQVYLFALVPLTFFYYKTWPHVKGRLAAFSFLGAAFFALFQGVGQIVGMQGSLRDLPPLLPGYFFLYAAVLCWLFILSTKKPATENVENKSRFAKLLSGEKKNTLCVWLLLCLCWLPYFILFFPGLATADSFVELGMGLGYVPLSSHHPPLHIFYLGLFAQLGYSLFGNITVGVAIATFLQMVALAFLLAFALGFMAKRGFPFWTRVAAFLLYALVPCFGWYAVTLWKDVWLAAFCLLVFLLATEVVRLNAQFFKSKKHVFALAVGVAGVILSKNNGIYVIAILFACFLLFVKGIRRQTFAVLLLSVVFWGLIEGPVYKALHIEKGDIREALSIPLLQVALVAKQAPDALNEKEALLLNQVLPFKKAGENYNPIVSDTVKSLFASNAFKQNLGEYAKLYAQLGLRYPNVYVRAFLEHTYAYVFPDAPFAEWALTPYTTFAREENITFGGLEKGNLRKTEFNLPVSNIVRQYIGYEHNLPGLSMLFAVGFYFWVLLFCSLLLCWQKKHKHLLPLVLLFAVWLTCLASPVNGSFRYGFPLVLCMPFVVGYTMQSMKPAKI